MKKNNTIEEYNIDAKGKAVGRVATEVAKLLQGKNKPNYMPNEIANVSVIISNIDKINIPVKKLEQTIIYSHSGYPGGLKEKKWIDLYQKNPKDLFMKVVKNMIPGNKHKSELLKKIKFS